VLTQRNRYLTGECPQTPELTDHDSQSAQAAITSREPIGLAHHHHPWSRTALAREGHENAHGVSTAHTIIGKAGIALEISKRSDSLRAIDAVNPAAVEAQSGQIRLKFRHIVTPHIWGCVRYQAVTKNPAGLDE